MTDVFIEEQGEQKIVYINALTRKLFRHMLNELKEPIVFIDKELGYGDALKRFDVQMFETLFNQWVTKCQDKGYMVIQGDNSSEKYLKWNQELNDIERALKSMKVLKGML